MLLYKKLLRLLWLSGAIAKLVSRQPDTLGRRAPVKQVYRGDSRAPDEIIKDGGFFPPGQYWNDPNSFNIERHADGDPQYNPDSDTDSDSGRCSSISSAGPCAQWTTAYVSTSTAPNLATRFAASDDGELGYLYRIHVTPNMFVYEASHEAEISALGGIPASAIMGWTRLSSEDEEFPPDIPDDRWTPNLHYNSDWSSFAAATSTPAGLDGENAMHAAVNFMNQPDVGPPMGWDGQFPLSLTSQQRLEAAGIDWASLPQLIQQIGPPFVGLACARLESYLSVHYGKTKRSSLIRPLTRGKQEGCGRLQATIQGLIKKTKAKTSNTKIPQPCHNIKNIEFGLSLADEYSGLGGEGTWDDIGGILEGKAGKAEFKIAEQPALGTSWWTPVKFPSDTIDITGIDKLSLTAEPRLLRWEHRDWFKVQDIRIRAQCADPGFEAKNDKFVGISQWYRHNAGSAIWQEPYTKQAVTTLQIHPGDWTFAPPCNIIKDLGYEFTLANGWGDGTGDKLTLILGEGTIVLGNSFKAGSTTKDKINIKKTFNKDTIDIRDLKTVAIGDDNSGAGLSDKSWTLQGVTFSATCADVSKKMQMNKFASENKVVSHKDNGPAWTGNIDAADWVEVA